MKRLLIVLFALILAGCTITSQSATPTDNADTLLKGLKEKNFEEARSVADESLKGKIDELQALMDRDPVSEAMLTMLLSSLDYEILSESVEKDSATVSLTLKGLTEEAYRQLSVDVMLAGFAVSDPADSQAVTDAILLAIDEIDPSALETVDRTIEFELTKSGKSWLFTENVLTVLSDTLLP